MHIVVETTSVSAKQNETKQSKGDGDDDDTDDDGDQTHPESPCRRPAWLVYEFRDTQSNSSNWGELLYDA